ncbi:hypothetical protein RSAG8_09432, partial [Rhizoctonia solani AG-8 WAC10335]
MCAFVQDYREGTIFDAVGSIGGLFALLQAAHVLIFGKPMLWGLVGAKLITPFGLLGLCSSKGFRRRLQDRYHGQNTERDSDVFRIWMFLRDYVIDFGPADFDPEAQDMASPNNPAPTSHDVRGE